MTFLIIVLALIIIFLVTIIFLANGQWKEDRESIKYLEQKVEYLSQQGAPDTGRRLGRLRDKLKHR